MLDRAGDGIKGRRQEAKRGQVFIFLPSLTVSESRKKAKRGQVFIFLPSLTVSESRKMKT